MLLKHFVLWFQKASVILTHNASLLTELDAPIGDADHGANISRGFNVISSQIEENPPKDIKSLLKLAAMTMMTKVGGASGMLYGNFFLKASSSLEPGKNELSLEEFAKLLRIGVDGIINRGGAAIGDKTMIDVWLPFVEVLESHLSHKNDNHTLSNIIDYLLKEAKINLERTKDLRAKKGRASYLGERSIGHQDPGATSTYFIIESLKEVLQQC